ncbi:Signal transduction histidine kinase [Spirosomataceae bacterium TFI 002]|nr:Signal transduction histidine kinase [Spirosomataceae bacterium TFI 002]
MTIRTRFTLLFLAIFSILLLVFCLVIYFESENHREQEFRTRLRNESITAAAIFFNKESISPDLFKIMAQKQMTVLNEEEVRVFDKEGRLRFENTNHKFKIDSSILATVWLENELFWNEGDQQMYATVIPNNEEEFVILTSAVDKYGISRQNNLAFILASGGVGMLLLGLTLGNYLIGSFLKPIKEIIVGIDKIKESNLSSRLNEGVEKDELFQLKMQFNQMLERLENAFESQKAFVSHASHELRTPLTSITGQIQVSLLANDNPEELKTMIESVLEDVQQLNKLANNLLELTTITGNESKFKVSLINIVELIFQGRSDLLIKTPGALIMLDHEDSDGNPPEVKGIESLLMIAILNLMDNGIKYADNKTVEVSIEDKSSELAIKFENTGKGITPEDMKNIFEPFKRGSNSHKIKGHGIGLSLTNKIIELHKGKIEVKSTPGKLTSFIVTIPKNI